MFYIIYIKSNVITGILFSIIFSVFVCWFSIIFVQDKFLHIILIYSHFIIHLLLCHNVVTAIFYFIYSHLNKHTHIKQLAYTDTVY